MLPQILAAADCLTVLRHFSGGGNASIARDCESASIPPWHWHATLRGTRAYLVIPRGPSANRPTEYWFERQGGMLTTGSDGSARKHWPSVHMNSVALPH